MAINPAPFARRAQPLATRITPDRRRHKRIALTLLGRFMRANKQEYPCKLQDISVGGAAILSPVDVQEGERIVVYLDQLGGLEGTVVRLFDTGFGMQFSATQHKREKLAAQLTWLINRNELDPSDERRHDRTVPRNGSSALKLAEGIVVKCQVLDVSLSGASIGTDARPPIGHEVIVGRLRARVMRYHDQGIGVQFLEAQDQKTLKDNFG